MSRIERHLEKSDYIKIRHLIIVQANIQVVKLSYIFLIIHTHMFTY